MKRLIAVILALGLLSVWMNLENVRTGYEVAKLEKKKAELTNYNRILNIEISQLKSLERIEAVAKKDLNLMTPEKFETLTLQEKPDKNNGIFRTMVSFVLSLF